MITELTLLKSIFIITHTNFQGFFSCILRGKVFFWESNIAVCYISRLAHWERELKVKCSVPFIVCPSAVPQVKLSLANRVKKMMTGMNPIGCAAELRDSWVVFSSYPGHIKLYSLEWKKNDFLFCVQKINVSKSETVLWQNCRTKIQSVFFMLVYHCCW